MRYPFPSVPDGWYFLCRSSDLPRGAIRSQRWFDQERALWRTESGQAVLSEAYCPHLGAHLGKGGEVRGDSIRCPFHGFCFEPKGACVSTPYGKPPPNAKLKTWPVDEIHGFILAYSHARGSEPTWRVPELDIEGWLPTDLHGWDVRAHPQETTENSVDIGHFTAVHGYDEFEVLEPLHTDGHYLRVRYGMTRKTAMVGAVRAQFTAHAFGLGYSFVEVAVPEQGLVSRQFVLPTPTSGDEMRLTVGMSMRPLERPGQMAWPLALLGRRLASALVRRLAFKVYVEDVEADFDIWQHKKYVDPPPLARGDGPIPRYRRWAKQFYSELDGGLESPSSVHEEAVERRA